jgi:hypothetical protein
MVILMSSMFILLLQLCFYFIPSYSYNSVNSCCSYFNDETSTSKLSDIITYINNTKSFKTIPNTKPSIAILVYASPNIWNYASYTLFTNAFFSEYLDYSIKFFSEENATYTYQIDNKWNKIGIALEALNPLTTWSRNYDAFLILDADVILLNEVNMNIRNILQQYTEANIILSGDALDVANAGVMIVRNNKWSYEFFSLWWSMRYDIPCDQHAFNQLYYDITNSNNNKILKSKKRIKILSSNIINLPFPFVINYNENDTNCNVLHLQGVSNEIRINIFKNVVNYICNNYHNNISYKEIFNKKYGIIKKDLLLIEYNYNMKLYNQQYNIIINYFNMYINNKHVITTTTNNYHGKDLNKEYISFNQLKSHIDELNDNLNVLHSITTGSCLQPASKLTLFEHSVLFTSS